MGIGAPRRLRQIRALLGKCAPAPPGHAAAGVRPTVPQKQSFVPSLKVRCPCVPNALAHPPHTVTAGGPARRTKLETLSLGNRTGRHHSCTRVRPSQAESLKVQLLGNTVALDALPQGSARDAQKFGRFHLITPRALHGKKRKLPLQPRQELQITV